MQLPGGGDNTGSQTLVPGLEKRRAVPGPQTLAGAGPATAADVARVTVVGSSSSGGGGARATGVV